jgi:hypothetical protein
MHVFPRMVEFIEATMEAWQTAGISWGQRPESVLAMHDETTWHHFERVAVLPIHGLQSVQRAYDEAFDVTEFLATLVIFRHQALLDSETV